MEISAAAQKHLLNWDHEIYPTSLDDIAMNIADFIAKGFTSDKVRVALTEEALAVEVLTDTVFGYDKSFGTPCTPYWKRVVTADLYKYCPRDITGWTHQWLPVSVYELARIVNN